MVVVDASATGAARVAAAAGASVVVAGTDAQAVGTLVADVVDGGGRAVGFVGDLADPVAADALGELLGELFAG